MIYLLTALLAGAVGWCWGHRTALVRHVPVGATAPADDAAFIAAERARFDELVAGLDLPDDPPECTVTEQRYTASTITDEALDALYAELEQLRAQRSSHGPREHCGHLSPDTLLTTPRTECVLRPGHPGSHADDRGCRWWPIKPEESTTP
ncbi:hypothetical protein ACIO02_35425 [Streptomyces sp. NPDC087568]|uniref:hypothetical protein n=1 Tax=Streptomyces sp. NPDC087568 TaxID=3365799 RepID=UPI00382B4184